MSLKRTSMITLGIWPLAVYILTVFFFGESVIGVFIRLRYLGVLLLLTFIIIYILVGLTYRYQLLSGSRLRKTALVSVVVLLSLVELDVGYGIYEMVRAPASPRSANLPDPCVLDNVFAPKRFRPTERNFHVYEANWAAGGRSCGVWSTEGMTPAILREVAEVRDQWYSTDIHGFRETTPMEQARIFALGDSFTYGQATHQDKIWTEVLERLIKRPVYNLGGSASSPKQQLMLLEYLLQTKGDSLNIERLLWMIWEGNDLEDSYEVLTSSYVPVYVGRFKAPHRFANMVRDASVIRRLSQGDLTIRVYRRTEPGVVPGAVPGVPVYHSERYGYRMFWEPALQRASQGQSYVTDHPNLPLLNQTFQDMRFLSEQYGFDVTVLAAPSASRLYAQYFEDLHPAPSEPYFIDHLVDLALGQEFDVVDLNGLMRPYAGKELLYWRDDPHWNERGNQVVAEIIQEQIFPPK